MNNCCAPGFNTALEVIGAASTGRRRRPLWEEHMHTRFTHTPRAAAALAVVGLTVAGPASAKTPKRVEPLNQYVISGKVDTDALAREGYDLREAAVTGKKGKFFIVATPSQARELAKKGATVTTPFGTAKSFAAPSGPDR